MLCPWGGQLRSPPQVPETCAIQKARAAWCYSAGLLTTVPRCVPSDLQGGVTAGALWKPTMQQAQALQPSRGACRCRGRPLPVTEMHRHRDHLRAHHVLFRLHTGSPPGTAPSTACDERRRGSQLLNWVSTHPSRNGFAGSSLRMADKVPHDVGGDVLRCVASLPASPLGASCGGALFVVLDILQEGVSYKARDISQQHVRGEKPSQGMTCGMRTSQDTTAVCCHQRQAVLRMMHTVTRLKARRRVCL